MPPGTDVPPSPASQTEPLRVYLERKGRGGKAVSVIKGLQAHPDGTKALMRILQQKLGTGGAVKEGEIEIQGDQRERIVALLLEMGYKAKKAGG